MGDAGESADVSAGPRPLRQGHCARLMCLGVCVFVCVCARVGACVRACARVCLYVYVSMCLCSHTPTNRLPKGLRAVPQGIKSVRAGVLQGPPALQLAWRISHRGVMLSVCCGLFC